MKKIFNWSHSRNKKYETCPFEFDFVKACQTGLVVWWNETQFCLDMNKIKEIIENKKAEK